MENFKGTKGPWYYGGGEQRAIFHPIELGYRLAVVDPTFSGNGFVARANDEWKANAQLIAAAPELLEALSDLWVRSTNLFKELSVEEIEADVYLKALSTSIDNAKSVITKALGDS
jgi:hypothetical protein